MFLILVQCDLFLLCSEVNLTCHVAQRNVHQPARPFPEVLLLARKESPLAWPRPGDGVDSIGVKRKQFHVSHIYRVSKHV